MSRSRTRLAVASSIGCFLLTVVLLVSYRLDMTKHGLAVTPTFHVGFFEGGVWFYSDYWPYHGDIIAIERPLKTSGLDFPGIYYRYFRYPASTWSLMVSLWYPILLSAILPVFWIFHHRRLH